MANESGPFELVFFFPCLQASINLHFKLGFQELAQIHHIRNIQKNLGTIFIN